MGSFPYPSYEGTVFTGQRTAFTDREPTTLFEP
jgi:hypothetical protein